jgi:hypothetical protein
MLLPPRVKFSLHIIRYMPVTRFRILAALALLQLAVWAHAQTEVSPTGELGAGWPVLVGSDTVTNPFAGGLNYPRYAKIDVDGDGREELVAFDRADNRLTVFANQGAPGQPRYVYAPDLGRHFPLQALNSVFALVDCDGDGKKDLITAGNNDLVIFKNITQPGGTLKWKIAYNPLQTRYSVTGPASTLYNLQTDIPGFADVDQDGDMDVLVYNVVGTRIELHKNWAMDSLNRADTLYLVLASQCFGHFAEAYNSVLNSYHIYLNEFCGTEFRLADGPHTPGGGQQPTQTAHAGGAIIPIQLNADSLIDLIVSDDGPTMMASVINGGTRAIAHIIAADSTYPRTDTAVNIPSFPVGFYLDFDEDGLRDLVIAPNSYLGSNDRGDHWYYRNEGADNEPDFKLQTRNFLPYTQIEVGSRAAPHFFDYNGDGKPDLVVGNLSQYYSDGYFRAGLKLYTNVGTAQEPVFQLADSNFLGFFSQAGLSGVSLLRPCAADLDADGDLDLVIGAYQKIWYFRNQGTATSPNYVYVTDTLGGSAPMSLQAEFAPLLTDWDGDGDMDMLCGTFGGTIAYFENTGSATQPQFSYITHNLGQVSVVDPLNPFNGQATPILMDLLGNNKPLLVVGSASGRIFVFDGVGAPPGATMSYVTDLLSERVSRQIALAAYPVWLADTLADSTRHQLVVGTLAGGLLHYHIANPLAQPVGAAQATGAAPLVPHITVFPNPANHTASVLAPAGTHLALVAPTGQVVWQGAAQHSSQQVQIPTHLFSSGLYLVVGQTPHGIATQRLWVAHPY